LFARASLRSERVRQAKTDGAPVIAAGSSWKSSFGQEYWKIVEQKQLSGLFIRLSGSERLRRLSGHNEFASLFGGFVGNVAERI